MSFCLSITTIIKRCDDVERGDRDDEHQDDPHHHLLDVDRVEQIAVVLRPVGVPHSRLERARLARTKLLDRERIVEPHRDTFGRAVQTLELACVLEIDERDVRVVVLNAGLEYARDRERGRGAESSGRP